MKTTFSEGTWWVCLERGDEIVATLTKFAADHSIYAGTVTGIGAVKNARLGFFDEEHIGYDERSFPQPHQLVSCSGNISLKDGAPFLHLHAVLSGRDMTAFGGHFFEGTISAAGEFTIIPSRAKVRKIADPVLGLALWNFEECRG